MADRRPLDGPSSVTVSGQTVLSLKLVM